MLFQEKIQPLHLSMPSATDELSNLLRAAFNSGMEITRDKITIPSRQGYTVQETGAGNPPLLAPREG